MAASWRGPTSARRWQRVGEAIAPARVAELDAELFLHPAIRYASICGKHAGNFVRNGARRDPRRRRDAEATGDLVGDLPEWRGIVVGDVDRAGDGRLAGADDRGDE